MVNRIEYEGRELELFAEAKNWKDYLRAQLEPYVRGAVLEVGAGLGGTTRVLAPGGSSSWTCLEPDPALAALIRASVDDGTVDRACRVREGTLLDLGPREGFDTILYVDVLEHIEDDDSEVRRATAHLRPGGALIVVSPAHQRLYTAFDEAIGHERRYDRGMITELTPPDASLERFRYLDMVGILASTGNRLLLRQSVPTPRQLAVWDRVMVPISRMLDPLLGYRVGKTVLAVWRKSGV